MKAIIFDCSDGKVVTYKIPIKIKEEDAMEHIESLPWYNTATCSTMIINSPSCEVLKMTIGEDGEPDFELIAEI